MLRYDRSFEEAREQRQYIINVQLLQVHPKAILKLQLLQVHPDM